MFSARGKKTWLFMKTLPALSGLVPCCLSAVDGCDVLVQEKIGNGNDFLAENAKTYLSFVEHDAGWGWGRITAGRLLAKPDSSVSRERQPVRSMVVLSYETLGDSSPV